MCLITKQKRVKILKEDLTVYKRFYQDPDGRILPWNPEFRDKITYEVREIHKQPLKVDNNLKSIYDRHVGYAYNLKIGQQALKLTHIHEGFHAVLTYERLNKRAYEDYVDYVCTIPKGSRVFTDKTGLIVSDTIILKEKIK